jgi:hypothetical protein
MCFQKHKKLLKTRTLYAYKTGSPFSTLMGISSFIFFLAGSIFHSCMPVLFSLFREATRSLLFPRQGSPATRNLSETFNIQNCQTENLFNIIFKRPPYSFFNLKLSLKRTSKFNSFDFSHSLFHLYSSFSLLHTDQPCN